MRVLQTPSQWPPWAVMWLLASCIYATCKWLTCAAVRSDVVRAIRAGTTSGAGPRLARLVFTMVALVWGVRLLLQGVFDVSEQLTAWWIRSGYHALTALFICLTVVYALAALGVAT